MAWIPEYDKNTSQKEIQRLGLLLCSGLKIKVDIFITLETGNKYTLFMCHLCFKICTIGHSWSLLPYHHDLCPL